MYDKVLEFHKAFGLAINQPFANELVDHRVSLMDEELNEVENELFTAFGFYDGDAVDPKKLTKELADLLYVVLGTAVTFGLPITEVFNAVHASNMSKLVEGKPVLREDGKVLKGPNYQEPNLDQYFKD